MLYLSALEKYMSKVEKARLGGSRYPGSRLQDIAVKVFAGMQNEACDWWGIALWRCGDTSISQYLEMNIANSIKGSIFLEATDFHIRDGLSINLMAFVASIFSELNYSSIFSSLYSVVLSINNKFIHITK